MTAELHRTAFVFAGGGSLGAIQVGALRALIEAGERPDFVVGASVGALNACYFAGRPDADGVAALEAIWRGIRAQDVFPVSITGTLNWLRGRGGLFSADNLRRLIERHLPVSSLEDSRIPVHVVATNMTGAPVCLSRGGAVDAVLASAAIPIAFAPVRIGDAYLMDGAIAGNTPILTAAELGASRIIVLQTGYACSMDGPPKGAVARGLHALTLLISNQMERDMQLLAGKVEIHVAPHLCPLDVSPFNFDHSAALIERAARNTRAWIEAGGLTHQSQPEDVAHDHAAAMSKAAAGGYDLVSYFAEQGAPLDGSPAFAADHGGKTYHFASAANHALFVAAPERYLPQYDGLCAFAMARNANVPADPLVYRVVEGRLYLNRDAGIHAKWEGAIADSIRRADAHWIARTQAGRAGP